MGLPLRPLPSLWASSSKWPRLAVSMGRLAVAVSTGAAVAAGVYFLAEWYISRQKQKPTHKNQSQTLAQAAIAKVKADLDEVWLALDTDRDGTVTKSELKAALARRGTASDTRVRKLFSSLPGAKMGGQRAVFGAMDAVDQDGDGRISKEEFRALFVLEANLLEAFQASDVNGDGALSPAEFKQMIENHPEIEVLISRRQLLPVYIYEQLDLDSDGKVTVLEFMKTLHTQQHLVDLFSKCDQNHDGFVDKIELAAALKNDDTLLRRGRAIGLKPVMVFEQLDLNGDGKLTLSEFMRRLALLKP